jgi:hypothetical protein
MISWRMEENSHLLHTGGTIMLRQTKRIDSYARHFGAVEILMFGASVLFVVAIVFVL